MILLDTNVVSEAMIRSPHPSVRAWLDAQETETLYLCTITVAELMFGVQTLPAGKRKNELTYAVERVVAAFKGRILPFSQDAARCYANLALLARRAGRGFPIPDAYIAAIAAANAFSVASRDTSPFSAVGLTVIDPWS